MSKYVKDISLHSLQNQQNLSKGLKELKKYNAIEFFRSLCIFSAVLHNFTFKKLRNTKQREINSKARFF